MFKAWHNSFGPEAQFLIVLGENMATQPSTWQDAKKYATQLGLPAGFEVVTDPKWMKISQAVNHGGTSISLPYMILFGEDMTILYAGNSAQTVQDKLIQLTGKTPQAPEVPDGTCQGACGDKAPTGCYCDSECKKFGDCCKDVCDLCGFC